MATTTTPQWVPVLADPEFDLPGWVPIPLGLAGDGKEQWLRDAAAALGPFSSDGTTTLSEAEVQGLLSNALDRRALAESSMVFQIWPSIAGRTAMCHLNMVPSDSLPSWAETDAVVHQIDAPHLGEGLQFVTTATLTVPGQPDVTVTGVHLVFDDGTDTVIVSIEEDLTGVVTSALPGVLLFVQGLRVVDTGSGADFTGVVAGAPTDAEWAMGEDL